MRMIMTTVIMMSNVDEDENESDENDDDDYDQAYGKQLTFPLF